MARTLFPFLALVFLAPCVSAAYASGAVEFSPPALVTGPMEAELAPGAYFAGYQSGRGVTASLEVVSDSTDFRIIDTTEDFIFLPGDQQACFPRCGDEQRYVGPVDTAISSIRVMQVLQNLTVVIHPDDAVKATFEVADIRSVVERPIFSAPFGGASLEPFPANSVSWPNKYLIQANGLLHHLTPASASLDYEGRFFLYLSDAMVRIENATGVHEVRTGKWRELVQQDPAGIGAQHFRYHHVALVGNVTGRLALNYAGPYAHLAAEEIRVRNVSTLSVPLANATIDLPGFRYESNGEPFVDLEGRFDVSLPDAAQQSETQRLAAEVSGQILRIQENRLSVRQLPPEALAAAAGGLGLLAVVYIAFSWVRRGAVYIAVRTLEFKFFTWVPFAAKLDLAKVLEHPVRKGIMEMLAGQHAMRNLSDLRRDVATAFGISTMAAYFHLRTLWRANHLTVVRMKSRHFIGPNSGGMGPKEQRVAASLLQHPVGFALAEYVCRNPGAPQKDIVAHVQGSANALGDPALSYGAVLQWIRKFERTTVVPTHLVRAFGRSLNPSADAAEAKPIPVALLVREADPNDARVVRYRPTDVLYDVVKTYQERRGDLGNALTELTRMRVVRAQKEGAPGSTYDAGTHMG